MSVPGIKTQTFAKSNRGSKEDGQGVTGSQPAEGLGPDFLAVHQGESQENHIGVH